MVAVFSVVPPVMEGLCERHLCTPVCMCVCVCVNFNKPFFALVAAVCMFDGDTQTSPPPSSPVHLLTSTPPPLREHGAVRATVRLID